jgi:hypothetical protein
MVLVKIIGVNKSEYRNCYILEKIQDFLSGFRKFLLDIGFTESDFEAYSFGRPQDKEGEPDITKEEDIIEYVDKDYFFANENYGVDLIFGKDMIFLIISTKEDKQKEISEKVQKFCKF